MFRDANGRLVGRSTKIKIAAAPMPGESQADTRRRTMENKRIAQQIADEYEQTARGCRVESHIRATLAQLHARISSDAIEFVTCRDFLNDWVSRLKNTTSPSTAVRYSKAVREFIKVMGAKADKQLTEITPADVQAFVTSRIEQGRSQSTVAVDMKALNRPFALALKQGIILSNPVQAAESPKEVNEARDPFTMDEVEALLRVTSGEWLTAVLLGAFQGMRLGDAVSLQWSNIDFSRKVITFRPQKSARRKIDLIVPLHPRVETHLLSLTPPDDAGDALICPELGLSKPGGRSGLSLKFARLLQSAGIEQSSVHANGEGGRVFNKKTFHSLRHFFVTELEAAGVPPDQRMKLAGHHDTRVHGRYSKTSIDTLGGALAKLK
jgi:integrase